MFVQTTQGVNQASRKRIIVILQLVKYSATIFSESRVDSV